MIVTQAARRLRTILPATLRASMRLAQVTSTMRADFFDGMMFSPRTGRRWTEQTAFAEGGRRARIARHGDTYECNLRRAVPDKIRHIRMARMDCRRIYVCERAPGGDSDCRTRKIEDKTAENSRWLRPAIFFRGVFAA